MDSAGCRVSQEVELLRERKDPEMVGEGENKREEA